MAKPYSEDLRRRVVEAIENGAIIPDTAEQCGVSVGVTIGRDFTCRHPQGRSGM